MVKYCFYLTCKTSTRKPVPGVNFVPFVKPTNDPLRCKRWMELCGKPQFNPENIRRCTYICTKHFPPDESHDWKENPDLEPFPVNSECNQGLLFQNVYKKVYKTSKVIRAEKVDKTSNELDIEDIDMEEHFINLKTEPNLSDSLEVISESHKFWFN